MTKLVDHFGTKYFAAHFAGEVKDYLTTVAEVDLADARICRDVMKYVLQAAFNGVEIHDTLDPEREAYFAENRRRREQQKNRPIPLRLPMPTCVEETLPFLQGLDATKSYLLWNGRSTAQLAFAFLVQAARPEIQLDLGSFVGEMLSLVYDNLFPTAYRWEEFYVLIGSTFQVQRPDPMAYREFISNHIAVPTAFGSSCLLKRPEWGPCVGRMSRLLEKHLNMRVWKIRDFL